MHTATMERTQSRFEELKQRVERETTALAELAHPERVDEKELRALMKEQGVGGPTQPGAIKERLQ
jgi:hypothetical protein